MAMTAWTALYYRLRANFDGYVSEACPIVPDRLPSDGEVQLLIVKRLLDMHDPDHLVTVESEDALTSQRDRTAADLAIGADGCNSIVRRLLLPKSELLYAGYVA
jgi:2-polyprenyl-6-methoxyphenol hydroxylase-like FAD-dependent oxidoreductase